MIIEATKRQTPKMPTHGNLHDALYFVELLCKADMIALPKKPGAHMLECIMTAASCDECTAREIYAAIVANA